MPLRKGAEILFAALVFIFTVFIAFAILGPPWSMVKEQNQTGVKRNACIEWAFKWGGREEWLTEEKKDLLNCTSLEECKEVCNTLLAGTFNLTT